MGSPDPVVVAGVAEAALGAAVVAAAEVDSPPVALAVAGSADFVAVEAAFG